MEDIEEDKNKSESNAVNINNEINNNINRRSLFQSTIAESNPIVLQLIEFGYNPIYSRRVFHYLHPEDLEEALNYMSVENNIIQHRFVQNNRNVSDELCYICSEKKENHLKELNISDFEDNINRNQNNNNNNVNHINDISNNNIEVTINNDDNHNINENINIDIKKSINSSINKSRNKETELKKNSSITELKSNSSSSFKKSEVEELFNDKTKNIKFDNKANITKSIKINDIKPEKKEECQICNEEFIVNENNKVKNCGHSFCESCWFDFLSVKINENKLPSIKCLDYQCQEKLDDEFIINLLKLDYNLIRKYKKYKLELEIINDPNKKMCPYPNCDSYLELTQIRNKDVTCLNNHTYCFICLKKPHGKLPCCSDVDADIREYAKNNFVKKCPKCSIITEKNNGCNHITCSKCGYQWCWLCNEKYSQNHFKEGKCKGFQFFQPKNDYEIKLVMEGKINSNELSNSQRQFDMGQFENDDDDFEFPHRHFHRRRFDDFVIDIRRARRIRHENEEEVDERMYNDIGKIKKILLFIHYLFFGHNSQIIKVFKINNNSKWGNIIGVFTYLLFGIAFFFQMIYINIIMLFPILLIEGFKKLIIGNLKKYIENFILVSSCLLLGVFFISYGYWMEKIRGFLSGYLKDFSIFLTFISCSLMSFIIVLPQRICLNIILVLVFLIKDHNFRELDYAINEFFGVRFIT